MFQDANFHFKISGHHANEEQEHIKWNKASHDPKPSNRGFHNHKARVISHNRRLCSGIKIKLNYSKCRLKDIKTITESPLSTRLCLPRNTLLRMHLINPPLTLSRWVIPADQTVRSAEGAHGSNHYQKTKPGWWARGNKLSPQIIHPPHRL